MFLDGDIDSYAMSLILPTNLCSRRPDEAKTHRDVA